MKFVQLMEMRSTKVDELQQLEDEWENATEGRRTLRKAIVRRDRNDAERVIVIAFFDDYDSAMVNSTCPRLGSSERSRLPFWTPHPCSPTST